MDRHRRPRSPSHIRGAAGDHGTPSTNHSKSSDQVDAGVEPAIVGGIVVNGGDIGVPGEMQERFRPDELDRSSPCRVIEQIDAMPPRPLAIDNMAR